VGSLGAYPWRDLFPPFIVEFGVGLAEDVVSLMLDANSPEVPLGALVARLVVDVHPDVSGGREERVRADAGNGALNNEQGKFRSFCRACKTHRISR
jgi:hypothetical protein